MGMGRVAEGSRLRERASGSWRKGQGSDRSRSGFREAPFSPGPESRPAPVHVPVPVDPWWLPGLGRETSGLSGKGAVLGWWCLPARGAGGRRCVLCRRVCRPRAHRMELLRRALSDGVVSVSIVALRDSGRVLPRARTRALPPRQWREKARTRWALGWTLPPELAVAL